MARNLLLVSNSKTREQPGVFLGYCEREIKDFLANARRVLFFGYAEPSEMDAIIAKQRGDESLEVPTSLERQRAYTTFMQPRFADMGYQLIGIEDCRDPEEAVRSAEAVYVGGGNTFDLLAQLYKNGVMGALQERIDSGMPYLGVSAGTVVAGPNISSSNDNHLPIPSSDALGVVPFCIKPHYKDKVVIEDAVLERIREISPDVAAFVTHQGESHVNRITEFHHRFEIPVVGLCEGAIIHVKGNNLVIQGTASARIFRRERLMAGYEPAELYEPGDSLDFLLKVA